MKNIKDIRNLEDLPIDTLSFRLKGKHQEELWDTRNRKSDHSSPSERFRNIWRYVHWYLDLNIGKPFDEVFSKFCKLTKQYHQKFFLEEFEDGLSYQIRKSYRLWAYWYVDENGLIQYKKSERELKKSAEPIIYYSDDYRTELRHKITGEVGDRKRLLDNTSGRYRMSCTHKGCPHNKCKHRLEDYELVVVSGYAKEYEFKTDREYMRLMRERFKKTIRSRKANKKRQKLNSYYIYYRSIVKQKEQERKAKEANIVKIESHGFDPLTSFRNIKQE